MEIEINGKKIQVSETILNLLQTKGIEITPETIEKAKSLFSNGK